MKLKIASIEKIEINALLIEVFEQKLSHRLIAYQFTISVSTINHLSINFYFRFRKTLIYAIQMSVFLFYLYILKNVMKQQNAFYLDYSFLK